MTSTIKPIATVPNLAQAREALAAAGHAHGVIAYVGDADFEVYGPTVSRDEAEAHTAGIWAEGGGVDPSEIAVKSRYITVND